MTPYLVQLRHWIFVKDYEFLSFVKDMGKTMGNKINKNLSSKKSKIFLIILKTCQHLKGHLKLLQKKQFKKLLKQLVIWSVITSLIKLQRSQEIYHRIVQR